MSSTSCYNVCMGRSKIERTLRFTPRCTRFGPEGCRDVRKEAVTLLHEEMEALYLTDSLGMYQEDAAREMGVSRPTFANIVKQARRKVTMMLVSGAPLEIHTTTRAYVLAVAAETPEPLYPGTPEAQHMVIVDIQRGRIISREVLTNPVVAEEKRPGQVLPEFLARRRVNVFIAQKIGSGLRDALLSKGIYTHIYEGYLDDRALTECERWFGPAC